MNYLILLAGGTGTRMNSNIPKQFLNLVDLPIIIHTLKNIVSYKLFDKIVIVCHKDFLEHVNDLLSKYEYNNIFVCEGGDSRLNSTINGCLFIKEKFGLTDDDIFVAHDSVRPFVSERIIKENIEFSHQYGAATTALPILETIQVLDSNMFVDNLLPRDNLVSGQSPQSFNIKKFLNCSNTIPKEVSINFTDLAEVFRYNNYPVKHVKGERKNIKITTPYDMILAEMLLLKDSNNIY